MTREEAIDLVRKYSPDYKIVKKSDVWWQKVIGFFMKPINPVYMSEEWTTIGNTTYSPSDETDAVEIIHHEGVHIQQKQRDGFLYNLKYLFPQCLAPVVSLGLGMWHPLYALFGLVFLLPWPAYWRMKYEMEAYEVTIVYLVSNEIEIDFDALEKDFTSSSYYWMWPFKNYVKKEFNMFYENAKKFCEYTHE